MPTTKEIFYDTVKQLGFSTAAAEKMITKGSKLLFNGINNIHIPNIPNIPKNFNTTAFKYKKKSSEPDLKGKVDDFSKMIFERKKKMKDLIILDSDELRDILNG